LRIEAVAAVAAVVAALAGCGGDGGGGAGLGGEAEVIELAKVQLADAPAGSLAWIAEEYRLADGDDLEHTHELAFAYAREGTNALEVAESSELGIGEGAVVPEGVRHRHGSTSGASTFWEIRLAPADAATPPGARRIFRSEPLEAIPDRPLASFLLVRIPPGGETSVHTHPGPELIYQLTGRILYQNALIGTVELGPGGLEGIPPGTAVQKRNRFDANAEFLSWFLVDPEEAFAPGSQFRRP